MIVPPERFISLVKEGGNPSERSAEFFEELARQVNLNTPITGTGNPEGVVTAGTFQVYLDTSGGAGTIEYRKMSGTGNTGWILV